MDNLMVGHGKEIDKERVYGIFQYGGSHRGFGRFKSAVRLKKRFNKYVKQFKNIFLKLSWLFNHTDLLGIVAGGKASQVK